MTFINNSKKGSLFDEVYGALVGPALLLAQHLRGQRFDVHVLAQEVQQLLLVCAEDGGLLHYVGRQEGLDHPEDEVGEGAKPVADQLELSIGEKFFGFFCDISGHRHGEVVSSEGLVISKKYEVIDIAFRVVLNEQVEHKQRVVDVLFNVLNLVIVEEIGSEEEHDSSLVVPAGQLVQLHKLMTTRNLLYFSKPQQEYLLRMFFSHCRQFLMPWREASQLYYLNLRKRQMRLSIEQMFMVLCLFSQLKQRYISALRVVNFLYSDTGRRSSLLNQGCDMRYQLVAFILVCFSSLASADQNRLSFSSKLAAHVMSLFLAVLGMMDLMTLLSSPVSRYRPRMHSYTSCAQLSVRAVIEIRSTNQTHWLVWLCLLMQMEKSLQVLGGFVEDMCDWLMIEDLLLLEASSRYCSMITIEGSYMLISDYGL